MAQAASSAPVTPAAPKAAAAPAAPKDRPLPPALAGVVTQEEFNTFNHWWGEQLKTPEWVAIMQKTEDLHKQQLELAKEGRDLREKILAANPEKKALYDKINDALKEYGARMRGQQHPGAPMVHPTAGAPVNSPVVVHVPTPEPNQ